MHKNVVVIAMANKLARASPAILASPRLANWASTQVAICA
jgi:hypothetical protein